MEKLKIPGRHDPCIVPRILPVVESVTAIILLDVLFSAKKIDFLMLTLSIDERIEKMMKK